MKRGMERMREYGKENQRETDEGSEEEEERVNEYKPN